MRFSFELGNKVQFDRAFNRVEKHIEDLRPVWDRVEKIFYRVEQEQFKSEGSKGRSGKWKPLSPEYKKRKEIEYPGANILYRTGALERSLTSKTDDTLLIKEKQEFGFGTRLFYAAFHQEGTSKMPARPPFDFSDSQRTDITKEIQKGLLEIMKGDRQVNESLDVE
jgi:phage gpG-like protein